MATAKVETIAKKVVKEVEEETFVLTLSRDEVETLYALTGIITGGTGTYGQYTNSIRAALAASGLYRSARVTYFSDRFILRDFAGDITAKKISK